MRASRRDFISFAFIYHFSYLLPSRPPRRIFGGAAAFQLFSILRFSPCAFIIDRRRADTSTAIRNCSFGHLQLVLLFHYHADDIQPLLTLPGHAYHTITPAQLLADGLLSASARASRAVIQLRVRENIDLPSLTLYLLSPHSKKIIEMPSTRLTQCYGYATTIYLIIMS